MNARLSGRARTTAASALVAVALSTLAAGCSTPARTDKAGGQTTVIRLATIDEVNNNGQAYGPEEFVNALEEVSDGRLKVEVLRVYGDGAAEAESRLVSDLAAGTIDGGWPSVRAFAEAGITGLEPVEAPMTITNYAAQKALVSGEVADEVVARLEGTGVVGLGLAVGPLRRAFATEAPLLHPSDWKDQPVRVYNSPVQAAAVRALGAEPVNLGFSGLDEAVSTGRLRGAEADIAQMVSNGGNPRITNVASNVVLWPKVYVLSVSQRFLDGLDEEQQRWVREAADRAVQVSSAATYDESGPAAELCELGFRFREAGRAELAAMKKALQPVIDDLAASESDAGLLAQVQAIAAEHPRPEPLDLDPECTTGAGEDTALGAIPAEVSPLPEGSYRVEISEDDVTRASLTNAGGLTGTWTLRVEDGAFLLFCRPLDQPGIDCGHSDFDGPLEAGDLRGTGQEAYFVYVPERLSELSGCTLPVSQTRPGACYAGLPYKMNWALEGDRLTFSDFVGAWADEQYLVKPWTRIS